MEGIQYLIFTCDIRGEKTANHAVENNRSGNLMKRPFRDLVFKFIFEDINNQFK